MYCTTCELEIKGDDKEICPVCGGALSDSQEAESTLEDLDRKEENGAEGILDDSESFAVSGQEQAADVPGQEEVFVLKDYEPDSSAPDTLANANTESDELPLFNDSAQGGVENVDDLLDSIRESIATPEQPKEDSMPEAEESSELDSDFSFFDSDPQDASTSVPTDATMEQGSEISFGYDEAEDAVSMPEAQKTGRSPVLKIVLIVVLIAVGAYYLIALRSDDKAPLDKEIADGDRPAEISQPVSPESQLEPVPVETLVATESSPEAQDQAAPDAAAVAEQAPVEQTNVAESSEAAAPEAQAPVEAATVSESTDALEPEVQVAPEVAQSDAGAEQAPVEAVKVVESPEAAAPEVQVVPEVAEAVAGAEQAPVEAAKVAELPEAEAPEVQVAPEKPAPVTAPFFTVHVGSYQKRASAASEITRIKAKGYDAFIERADLGGRGTWYRVKVGRFKNRAEAEQLQKKIKKNLVADSMVVMQRNN